ncbi:unnamed protein product [Orchesella dallaii]|uniref:Uncharacterized protein n=1 Tax=Orchesella dallaii TaxID=48710 RepID=A0ABP1Q7C8_9HEXA
MSNESNFPSTSSGNGASFLQRYKEDLKRTEETFDRILVEMRQFSKELRRPRPATVTAKNGKYPTSKPRNSTRGKASSSGNKKAPMQSVPVIIMTRDPVTALTTSQQMSPTDEYRFMKES